MFGAGLAEFASEVKNVESELHSARNAFRWASQQSFGPVSYTRDALQRADGTASERAEFSLKIGFAASLLATAIGSIMGHSFVEASAFSLLPAATVAVTTWVICIIRSSREKRRAERRYGREMEKHACAEKKDYAPVAALELRLKRLLEIAPTSSWRDLRH